MSSTDCCREVWRVARKAYACSECDFRIAPGYKYQYLSGIYDGSPFAFRTCSVCAEIRERLQQVYDHDETRGTIGRLWDDYDYFFAEGAPNTSSLSPLAAHVLTDRYEEWKSARRR